METMHFHIAETNLFFKTTLFCVKGVSMNNLAPMRNCPGGARKAILDARVRESFVSVTFGLGNTVGGVSQYKLGLISAISSNAKLHQCSKVYTFKL